MSCPDAVRCRASRSITCPESTASYVAASRTASVGISARGAKALTSRPTICSAVKPDSFSAAAFQLVTIRSRSKVAIPSPVASSAIASRAAASCARLSSVMSVQIPATP